MSIINDPWYKQEIVPEGLAVLQVKLRAHFKVGAMAIGCRGNPETHFRGYHRSRAFILNSPRCTDRGYSVTAEVNKGGNPNWVSGMDMTLPKAVLLAVCQRLNAAVLSGKMEKVLEWYGNLDGDTRVDGYDNIANRVASSDSSHLWHLHFSVARAHANDNHDDLFYVLTGTEPVAPPAKDSQAVRIHDPNSLRVVETIVPAGSGITNWMQALHHWYRSPGEPGSTRELEHMWRFRHANFSGAGRWETLTPGKTILFVPRTLGN
jgi:hypothetical protein